MIFGTCIYFPHFLRDDYTGTIVNKRIIKQNNIQRYFIYVQLDDGRIKVFENRNSLLELKINSEDIYYGLMSNRKYEIRAYGVDVPLFGYYQNISRVKGIKSNIRYYYSSRT